MWRTVTVLLAVLLSAASAYAADTCLEAERLIAAGRTADAIQLLEANLPTAGGNLKYLCLLRHAYRSYVRQLMREGQRSLAASYLKKLNLLESTSSLQCDSPAATNERNDLAGRAQLDLRRSQLPGNSAGSPPSSLTSPPRRPAVRLGPIIETGPIAEANPNRQALLEQADRLFEQGRYEEAAPLYDRACEDQTDLSRRTIERWAYCRIRQLVQRINKQPSSRQEWEAIEAESKRILQLVPGNRYVLFLRDLAASHGNIAIASTPVTPEVVRASSPEGPAGPAASVATLASRILAALHAKVDLRDAFRRSRQGRWQAIQTPSFVIYHMNPTMAESVARVAERARVEVYKTWFGREPAGPWQPKCVIYLYPSGQSYARATGQGPASPGHSSTGLRGGRVTSRRIDLRGDAKDLVRAILPHEITHVVMADRFNRRPLPRWADEGVAILSEPAVKKHAHLRNLGRYLDSGRLFSARQLMSMGSYPPGDMWGLFYAESVSLVDFLVQRRGPKAFVRFMDQALESGYVAALRSVYGFNGFDDLERAWSKYRPAQVAQAEKYFATPNQTASADSGNRRLFALAP